DLSARYLDVTRKGCSQASATRKIIVSPDLTVVRLCGSFRTSPENTSSVSAVTLTHINSGVVEQSRGPPSCTITCKSSGKSGWNLFLSNGFSCQFIGLASKRSPQYSTWSSGCLVDFAGDAVAGFQCSIHPARHRRGVFAGKMYSAFRTGDMRHEQSHFARPECGICATRPFVVVPAF